MISFNVLVTFKTKIAPNRRSELFYTNQPNLLLLATNIRYKLVSTITPNRFFLLLFFKNTIIQLRKKIDFKFSYSSCVFHRQKQVTGGK
jgi:hypothetical protein